MTNNPRLDPLIRTYLTTRYVLSHYCSRAGKATNMLRFLCWYILKDADLGIMGKSLADGGITGNIDIPGDASVTSPPSTEKLTNKDKNRCR